MMRKSILLLTVLLILAIPLVASADLLGTGTIHLQASTPNVYGYAGDYDGQVVDSTFGYTTGLEEFFCVSSQEMNSSEAVSFYTIDGSNANLSKAAWIADYWKINYSGIADDYWNDYYKAQAQGAIWATVGVIELFELGWKGVDYDLYKLSEAWADDNGNYTTNNWYFADSVTYQDYLTPVAPVPEPATMLLLGTGLVGLAGMSRKKFKK